MFHHFEFSRLRDDQNLYDGPKILRMFFTTTTITNYIFIFDDDVMKWNSPVNFTVVLWTKQRFKF